MRKNILCTKKNWIENLLGSEEEAFMENEGEGRCILGDTSFNIDASLVIFTYPRVKITTPTL